MRARSKQKGPTEAEKMRVLVAYKEDKDWKLVAKHNGVAMTTARRVVNKGHVNKKPRGGARMGRSKVTPAIRDALERYVNGNCSYTLTAMKEFIAKDFPGVELSLQTISRHLLGMLYTIKTVRIEPATCNNDANKTKRKAFVETLLTHQQDGDYIVYYDETNFNIYCHRTLGRAKKVQRATLVLPPSKGPNLQVQCTVSAEHGLVCHQLERGSIKMAQNAAFVEEIYQAVKSSATWNANFQGKRVVIILDNAPAHSQTEQRVQPHHDLVLLRLGPYSPMLNPIESCFSVLKAHIKRFLAARTNLLFDRREYHTFLESRMRLLEEAA
ncbi:hypothetical protein DYB37_009937 [Aphanomyces astaci]|uniref:Tc1-like transposase DDE domain-containing protein n=1 Tax=Aphanomyces astaci TaxID=112090 RepID=A0A418EHD4_APHAT|nr:hypothetical protein DYB37_009937 [Aphanomyces astaci]